MSGVGYVVHEVKSVLQEEQEEEEEDDDDDDDDDDKDDDDYDCDYDQSINQSINQFISRHSTEARATVRLCRIEEKCLETNFKCVNGWSSSTVHDDGDDNNV